MADELALNQIVITVSGRPKSGKSTILYLIFDALRGAGFNDVLIDDPDLFRHGFYRQQSNRVRYLAESVHRPITLSSTSMSRSEASAPRQGEPLALPEMPVEDVSGDVIDAVVERLLGEGEHEE